MFVDLDCGAGNVGLGGGVLESVAGMISFSAPEANLHFQSKLQQSTKGLSYVTSIRHCVNHNIVSRIYSGDAFVEKLLTQSQI